MQTLKGCYGRLECASFSPDGSLVAAGSSNGTHHVWDLNTETRTPSKPVYEQDGDKVDVIQFSADGTLLAKACSRKVSIWDTNGTAATPLSTVETDTDIHAMVMSPDMSHLVIATRYREIEVWDITTATAILLQSLEGHNHQIRALSFSPDGQILASAGRDWAIRFWDPLSYAGAISTTSRGHTGYVNSLAFSPDGFTLASASDDRTIRLWTVGNTEGVPSRTLNVGVISELSFSSDGTSLVTNRGTFDIETIEEDIASTCQCFSPFRPPKVDSKISVEHEWIVYDKQRLFWRPPDYWPGCTASFSRDTGEVVIALGDYLGNVIIIECYLKAIE